ncbi:MAG: chorismate-binding protein [Bacteroidales bacterium]|nr:chorismate-binding protein [Bacteroidales bacterium]
MTYTLDIDPTVTAAIDRCCSLNIPFAALVAPGERHMTFFASLPDPDNPINKIDVETNPDWEGLAITNFDQFDPPYMVGIEASLSAREILDLPSSTKPFPEADLGPQEYSTPYPAYYVQVHEITTANKREGAKTVLSRVVAGHTSRPLSAIIQECFTTFPSTFRFVYFTQETGLWIGATPEVLLDYNYSTSELTTMSLAGTRPASDSGASWDEKNLVEHDVVTGHIMATLLRANLNPEVYDATPLRYGDVEHLCERIRAKGKVDVFNLIHNLAPTPAVNGFPYFNAQEQILAYELHERYCYGGTLAYKHGQEVNAYVNLRSALLAFEGQQDILYNIYCGGGIMPTSVAADEWREAAMKIGPLYQAFNRDNTFEHPSLKEISTGQFVSDK